MKIDNATVRKIASEFPLPFGRVNYIFKISPTFAIAMLVLKMDAYGFDGERILDLIDHDIKFKKGVRT